MFIGATLLSMVCIGGISDGTTEYDGMMEVIYSTSCPGLSINDLFNGILQSMICLDQIGIQSHLKGQEEQLERLYD